MTQINDFIINLPILRKNFKLFIKLRQIENKVIRNLEQKPDKVKKNFFKNEFIRKPKEKKRSYFRNLMIYGAKYLQGKRRVSATFFVFLILTISFPCVSFECLHLPICPTHSSFARIGNLGA